MTELEVYLVSEIGETCLGTVGEILGMTESLEDLEPLATTNHNAIFDIVNAIAFSENQLSFSMPVTIELREPQRPQNVI